MLDKILSFIADKLNKTPSYKPVETATIPAQRNAKYTATENGLMIVRAVPTGGGLAYCYIGFRDPNVPATAGGYEIAHLITDKGNKMTKCIPMIEGCEYLISDIYNTKEVSLFLYPFEKIGGY